MFTNVNGMKENENGNSVAAFIGTIDYIFFTKGKFQLKQLHPIMDLASATANVALPSESHGSDHVPLSSTLQFI